MRTLILAGALALAFAAPAGAQGVPDPGADGAGQAVEAPGPARPQGLTAPVEHPAKAPTGQAAEAPKPRTITLVLNEQEARDLIDVLDAAIKASGYSPLTVKALRIGEKVERAALTPQPGR